MRCIEIEGRERCSTERIYKLNQINYQIKVLKGNGKSPQIIDIIPPNAVSPYDDFPYLSISIIPYHY